jgi:CubicO group peptidase (beta-lactamase class C family)
MKKISLFLILFFTLDSFSQELNNKIKLFENNLFHWDTSKTRKWSLKERMAFYNVHAVSIALIKDYKIEWVKAYGYADVSENRPATTQTLFQAASISKSINSLGILKLAEEGKLGLDDDINKYLKEWKFPYDSLSNGKKISVGNLLNHKAGLSIGGFKGYEKGQSLPTTIQTLDGLKPSNSNAVRSLFEPGLKFQYSGGGTTVSQLILENISGEQYEAYMKKNILTPLGMTNSFFNQPPDKEYESLLATGYLEGKEVKGKYHLYPEKAAAGLWTNPTDLAKYIIETQLSSPGQSNKVLTKEMSAKRLQNNYGVFLNDFKGAKYFGHSGGNEGFMCHYFGSLENGYGMVVMTNGSTLKIVDEIFSSLANLNNWKNYPAESKKESIYYTIRKRCHKNIDKGIKLYKKLKKNNIDRYNFSNEDELNKLGYEYLNEGKLKSAIKIFNLGVTEFPTSSNVYDSRGEAYFNKKEYQLSKADYLKSLELDPTNQHAKEMLLKIEKLLQK